MSRNPAVIPAAVENGSTYTTEVGIKRASVKWVLTPEDFERVRQGMVCLKCMEPQETPFPDVCSLPGCGYPMAMLQIPDLETEDEGEVHLGPSTSLAEEQDRLSEWHEKQWNWSKDGHILVPASVKNGESA